jgi:hypothetical protein|tara:strand:+ start:305 stop:550 length:246 start_codon:yes stop_codon:yes gene_type:complete
MRINKMKTTDELYDSTVDDLIEWELNKMSLTTLQEFYSEEMKQYFYTYPQLLDNMLQHREEAMKEEEQYAFIKPVGPIYTG